MEQITLTKEKLELLNSIQERHVNGFDCLVNDVFNEIISNSNTFKEAKEKLKELRIHSGMQGETTSLLVVYEKAEEKLEERINATLINEWRKGGIAMFKILNDLKTSLKNHPWGWKEHLPYLLILSMSLIALILGILSMILS